MNAKPIAYFTAVALLAASLAFSPPRPNIFLTASASAVLLETHDGYGSGFVFNRIDPTGHVRWFAWTAAHVVEDHDTLEVRTTTVKYRAHVIARNSLSDIALLRIDAPQANVPFIPCIFSESPVDLGDSIFVVGSPGGPSFLNCVTRGNVAMTNPHPTIRGWRWPVSCLVTAPIYPGSSGAPVFNSVGHVLGLVVGGVDPNRNAYVPVDEIRKWCKSEKMEWAIGGMNCPSFSELDVPKVDPKWFFQHSF